VPIPNAVPSAGPVDRLLASAGEKKRARLNASISDGLLPAPQRLAGARKEVHQVKVLSGHFGVLLTIRG
jgi:hypothetical protein